MIEGEYTGRHFSLSNAEGLSGPDLPLLFRRLADTIESEGIRPEDLLDVTLGGDEVNEHALGGARPCTGCQTRESNCLALAMSPLICVTRLPGMPRREQLWLPARWKLRSRLLDEARQNLEGDIDRPEGGEPHGAVPVRVEDLQRRPRSGRLVKVCELPAHAIADHIGGHEHFEVATLRFPDVHASSMPDIVRFCRNRGNTSDPVRAGLAAVT